MRGLDTFLLPYIASQIISVIFLYVAFRNTRLARLLFALMFLYAGCYNMYIGFAKPDEYQGFAELALPLYHDFINGWFSSYNYLLIPLIALGQLGIGLGMVLQDQWVQLACIGAIIFLLSIAPLMVGSAFPFSLTVSFALLLILRNDDMNVLWGPEERS